MDDFSCKGCGSNEFREENGYRICSYCGRKHIITAENKRILPSSIEMNNDVERLLQKCKTEPERAKKIAERILEIDPYNEEAKKILEPQSKGCYVATAVYGSYDCPQVWTLRRYRDYTLAKTWYGRAIIHTYYTISPALVKWFGHTEWFRNMWKPKLDRMVIRLNRNGVQNTPYQARQW